MSCAAAFIIVLCARADNIIYFILVSARTQYVMLAAVKDTGGVGVEEEEGAEDDNNGGRANFPGRQTLEIERS